MSEIKHLDLGSNTDYAPVAPAPSQATETVLNYQATPTETPMAKPSKLPLIILGIAVLAGSLTGVGAQRLMAKTGSNPLTSNTSAPISQVATGTIKNGDVFGTADEKTFKDSAEGYLEKNTKPDSEGTHRLVRAGGESQTVNLTSSVTDLDKFDGMNLKVWGETFKGQKAGWLMDVGRVQVLSTQGAVPTE